MKNGYEMTTNWRTDYLYSFNIGFNKILNIFVVQCECQLPGAKKYKKASQLHI